MRPNRTTIYADHAATTPLRAEVRHVMAQCAEEGLGNPSSGHAWGRRARRRLEGARASAAESLGTTPDRVFFTRGGTESDNLAVLGPARRARTEGTVSPLVVTSSIEHPAVFEAARQVVAEGGRHVVVEVSPDGALDVGALRDALAERPAVASFMWVNNETGLVLPVAELAERCRSRRVPLHSDAVQAVGKVPVSMADAAPDLLTVTGHKIGGPMGVGVLVASDPAAIAPLHVGGGQEGGLRPGTEDVAGAAGFAEALRLAVEERQVEADRLEALRDEVEARLLGRGGLGRSERDSLSGLGGVEELTVACDGGPRAPHITALRVASADSDTLLAALDADGVAASGGSACASGSSGPSRTLAALYPDDPAAYPGDPAASLRLSFGCLTRRRHAGRIVEAVASAVERARAVAAL